MPSLVQHLFDGPLDIVGDVHGEIGALRSLMGHLGYDMNGRHPDGRRLVFLGDLTDRGPDSPAVVDLVSELIDVGWAQCVLGNHDLNILLDRRKPENRWFWGEDFVDGHGQVVPQRLADAAVQQRVCALIAMLPPVLVRDDLRIVHACWDDEMIGHVDGDQSVVELYEQHRLRIEKELTSQNLDKIDCCLQHQNRNPVKLLTSGPEERSEEPIEAGGKIRHERRVQWWNGYEGTFCVFGHYSISDGEPRGNGSSFCIDYGVGKRWTDRRAGKSAGFMWKLAALRWPERVVVFDEGEIRPCGT
jgi:hypothetical protein